MQTIRRRSNESAADFWKGITASGHLAPLLPIIYEIKMISDPSSQSMRSLDPDSSRLEEPSFSEPSMKSPCTKQLLSVALPNDEPVYEIRMQDLVAPMVCPCALGLVMGCRTVTSDEFDEKEQRAEELLQAMEAIDQTAPTEEEKEAGGVNALRYLSFLDQSTSTASLGFRIDGGKTVVNGTLDALPLPNGLSINTLKEEDDLVQTFKTFLQNDGSLAAAVLNKVESVVAALERSTFFKEHIFLRSTMLLVYDDAARATRLELKMTNFGASYRLPEYVLHKSTPIDHAAPWDGQAGSHEDGYMTGVQSLERIMRRVVAELGGGPRSRSATQTSIGSESVPRSRSASKEGE